MEEDKSQKSTENAANVSKHVSFHSNSAESIEIAPLASTSCLKPRKSFSLLSTLVRRTKLKAQHLDRKVQALQQSNNLKLITSNSSLGTNSADEMELALGKVESVEDTKRRKIKKVELTDSELSLPSSTKTKRSFFGKFLKKHALQEPSKKKSSQLYAIEGSKKNYENISEIKDVLERTNCNMSVQYIPTSFIQLDTSCINTTLTQGLVTVQNLAVRLQQSEGHLIQIFTKYVTDSTLQKQLVDTLCVHSNLHLETERMTNVLSMEMWLKQIEIEKVQESALQDALNSVIRQNRQLQTEYEMLFCTYERLLKKFKNFQGRDVGSKSVVGK